MAFDRAFKSDIANMSFRGMIPDSPPTPSIPTASTITHPQVASPPPQPVVVEQPQQQTFTQSPASTQFQVDGSQNGDLKPLGQLRTRFSEMRQNVRGRVFKNRQQQGPGRVATIFSDFRPIEKLGRR